MASDAVLQSAMYAKQVMFTPATLFSINEYCYYIIEPPSDFTADMILYIKVDYLYGSECYLNFGGSISTAGTEKTCVQGQTYSYNYQSLGQVSSVYLISVATANNAHIKFTYWAEPKIAFGAMLGIFIGGLTIISIGALALVLFCINKSIRTSLNDTIQSVRRIFIQTIEEQEPGKI